MQSATVAAKTALIVLGNTLAQMTKERCKKIVKDLNKDLLPLAEEAEIFNGAVPLLFGPAFEKNMKDHLES